LKSGNKSVLHITIINRQLVLLRKPVPMAEQFFFFRVCFFSGNGMMVIKNLKVFLKYSAVIKIENL